MTLHDDSIYICLYNGTWLQCAHAYIHSEHPLLLGCDWMICTLSWRMHYLVITQLIGAIRHIINSLQQAKKTPEMIGTECSKF